MASHPAAPLQPFLTTLREEVLSGYQRNGFPDAEVTARLEPGTRNVRVHVREGPRFYSCGVRVVGARKTLARLIASCLTNSPPEEDSADTLHWKPGGPAYFDPGAPPAMENVVKTCLAQHGWFFPKLALRVERIPASASAELVAEVLSLGPPGKIEELAVSGNRKNSTLEILRFVHLKRGLSITSDGISEAEKKLRASGRFLQTQIEPELFAPGKRQSKGIRLAIKVWEYEAAPRLVDRLTAKQTALLRLCDWLSNFESCPDDAVFSFTYTAQRPQHSYTGDLILSPPQGSLVRVRDSNTPALRGGYTFLLWTNAMGIIPAGRKSKLVVQLPDFSLSPNAWLTVGPSGPGVDPPFNLTLGLGWNFESDAQTTNEPPRAPGLRFDLLPAGFLYLGDDTNGSYNLQGGVLTLSNSLGSLKADASTGRMLEYAYSNSEMFVSLRFESGAFDQARKNAESEAVTAANAFDSQHPVGSLTGFVTGELLRWWFFGGLSTNANSTQDQAALEGLSRLVSGSVFDPLDRARVTINPATFFWIPADDVDRAVGQNSLFWPLVWLTRYTTGSFSRDSWPGRLGLDAVSLFANQATNAVNDLARLCASPDLGPLGCLSAASLASRFDLPVSWEFAQNGLNCSSAADFQRDCRLFLQGDSAVAQCFARIAAVLREMPQGEVDAVAAAVPLAEGRLIKRAHQALNTAPEQPLSSSFAHALDEYWESSLRSKVRAALTVLLSRPQAVIDYNTNQVYHLPFPPQDTFRVVQGQHGAFSHFGDSTFAIDFGMPEGTPVLAARDGVVVQAIDGFDTGAPDPAYRDRANLILVRHSDGTLAEYGHLRKGTLVVKPGDSVRVAELLGLSGNSGYSQGPHLHFMVFRVKDNKTRDSLPVRFLAQEGSGIALEEGRSYTATAVGQGVPADSSK